VAIKHKRLGKHGVLVSNICLGTMNFGPQASEEDSHRIMDGALEQGINYFDTAHVYASGYDVAGGDGMRKTLDQLTSIIPAQRVRACHCNDTTVPLGGRADRHHHIGQGNVGLEGFRALLTYEPLAHCAFVLETPGEEMLEGLENLTTLRALA